jgi:uncharacterized protein (DUF1810 family)
MSFDLERFVQAQNGVFSTVLAELRAGRKRTHWMWFIFPQMRDLGFSPLATLYGIASLDEACAYLAHPILAERLMTCTNLVLRTESRSLEALFGSPDDRKFHSSMTLFAQASADRESPYRRALERWFAGEPDARTIEFLPVSSRSMQSPDEHLADTGQEQDENRAR